MTRQTKRYIIFALIGIASGIPLGIPLGIISFNEWGIPQEQYKVEALKDLGLYVVKTAKQDSSLSNRLHLISSPLKIIPTYIEYKEDFLRTGEWGIGADSYHGGADDRSVYSVFIVGKTSQYIDEFVYINGDSTLIRVPKGQEPNKVVFTDNYDLVWKVIKQPQKIEGDFQQWFWVDVPGTSDEVKYQLFENAFKLIKTGYDYERPILINWRKGNGYTDKNRTDLEIVSIEFLE